VSRRSSWPAAAALALALAGAVAAACRGAPSSPAALQARVDALFGRFTRGLSPGCALAVVEDGRVTLARGYGFADLRRRLPITPRTVFDIASASKQFTAASVLLLAARGRLSLDDDVRKYLPELPRHDAAITLRQLLHHTSGLPNYLDLLAKAGKRYEEVTTDDDALAALAGAPELLFAPGTAFRYNDSGYFLLSLVVKRVTGESLRQFAAENLFAPLGMTDTRIVDDLTRQVPRRAVPYAPADGGFEPELSRWEQTGDGGVNSTVLDLARWESGFDSGAIGGAGAAGAAAGKALASAMTTPGTLADGRPLAYGGGLFLDRFHGLRRVHHPGSWRGFGAELLRLPDRRLAVITLCNVSDADPAGLSEQVAELYLDAQRQ
jgi:CubicO group peptidase (beta-lactamase class C family)